MTDRNWWDLEPGEQGYYVEVKMQGRTGPKWKPVKPSGNSAPHIFNHEAALCYIKNRMTQKSDPGGYRVSRAPTKNVDAAVTLKHKVRSIND